MPITKKEAELLNNAKAEVKRLWTAACVADGVDPSTKFVEFSDANPHVEAHNNAMGNFFRLRNHIKNAVTRRERKKV